MAIFTNREKESKMNGNIPCCLCGKSEISLLSERDRHGKPLTTVICTGCGLVRHHPLPTPEEVRQYYEKDYRLDYKKTLAPKPRHIYRAGLVAAQRVKAMNAWLSEARHVLDIGAGGGELCYMMQGANRQVTGIEPNRGYALHAKEKLGINMVVGDYQTSPLAPSSFDLITMFHVLEHILEPSKILLQARDWLRPEGHLIVEVPNVEALCGSPKNRFHFAHIYNFNLATLESLGQRAGFFVRNRYVANDGGIIRVVFQKTSKLSELAPDLGSNAKGIESLLQNHTPLRHLFSHYPYLRLWRKILRGFDEWTTVRSTANGETLLGSIKQQLEQTERFLNRPMSVIRSELSPTRQ
jgi:2-polyprenyl-3-methyl-5-hydroxy-6-metoxy-1,4-benzoquinol methylase